jgi:hypothetical protein
LVLTVALAGALAADWPQWGRDATRNAVSPEKGAPIDFQLPYDDGKLVKPARGVAWKADLGSRTLGTPTVADGLVWIGTNAREPAGNVPAKEWDGGVLMCFSESDGKLLWRHRSPRLTANHFEDFSDAALGAAPLVEGDRLWYVNNRCEVVCFDIAPLKKGTGEPREAGGRPSPGTRTGSTSSPTTAWTRGTSTSPPRTPRAWCAWRRRPARWSGRTTRRARASSSARSPARWSARWAAAPR